MVINIHDTYNFMSAFKGYLFYHAPHFSVSYQSYIHFSIILKVCKDTIFLFAFPLFYSAL